MKSTLLKSLIVVYSYHHKNTEKVANIIARVLNTEVKHPQDIIPEDIQKYDLIGFGSGIDSGKHYEPILKLADTIPIVKNKKAFIFSTSAIMGKEKVANDHSTLREKLVSKGYMIVDEFSCKGFNTNSFLKYFGGMNKGRPNTEDLEKAEAFAKELIQHID